MVSITFSSWGERPMMAGLGSDDATVCGEDKGKDEGIRPSAVACRADRRRVVSMRRSNRLLFQGLFLAPHVVSQAIKGAIFAAGMFEKLGYKTLPLGNEVRGDIIQAIELGSAEKLIAFCGGIQKYSPVDSFAKPEPWDMPGYADQVIMAAGTFVQGASIEFSADGPLRAPYNVYLQGGLTFEHAVIGIMGAAQAIEDLQS
jgi:cystathionine beta-lyase family protein involved in aluminum resistance